MKHIIYLLLAQLVVTAAAQNTLRPNLYFPNNLYYNAGAGLIDSNDKALSSIYVKGKAVEEDNEQVWNKPASFYLSHAGRFKEKNFYHLAYIHDTYSFYKRNTIYAGIGRSLPLGTKSQLSFGIRPLLNFDNVDWEELGHVQDPGTSNSYVTFDLDIGAQYAWGGLMVGLAAKNLLESASKVEDEVLIQNWREWYLNASFRIGSGEGNFNLSPFILYFQERDIEFDIGLNLELFNRLNVAYALRTFELRNIFTARVDLFDRFALGAAADFSDVFSDVNFDFVLEYSF